MAGLDFFRVACACNKCTGVVMCAERNLLPTTVKPTHYALFLHPDLDKHTFSGRVAIALECLVGCDVISLHANELELKQASFGLVGADAKPCTVGNFDAEEQTVSITLPESFHAGEKGELSIEFTGILNDQVCCSSLT